MIAAYGNGEKKAADNCSSPTTEAATATPTTTAPTTTAGASSETKKYHLQILNVSDVKILVMSMFLKDWVEFKKSKGNPQQYQYTADGYNVVTLTGYSKDQKSKLGKMTPGVQNWLRTVYILHTKTILKSFSRYEIQSDWN